MTFESTFQHIVQRTPTIKSFQIPRPEGFVFKAGQFIEVTIRVDGQEQKKYFTISSSPNEVSHLEFTKRITDSPFSQTLDALKSGEWVKVNGPMGLFTLEKAQENKIAFLSGGIGITPIYSMCRFASEERLDYDIVLIYGNRSVSDIAFGQELDAIAASYTNMRVVHTLDHPDEGWKGRAGIITEDMIKDEIPDYVQRTFFVCGPPKMVESLSRLLLEDLHIPQPQVIIENFTGYS